MKSQNELGKLAEVIHELERKRGTSSVNCLGLREGPRKTQKSHTVSAHGRRWWGQVRTKGSKKGEKMGQRLGGED